MKTIYEEWSMWQRLLSMLENQFGIHCEFILHDLTKDYNHTVVDIRNGYITGRKIGDCGNNLGLEVLRGTVKDGDRYNYVVHTRDGKILRSSTMFIKDDNDKVIGCLCINMDITETVKLEEFLKQYNSYDLKDGNTETPAPNPVLIGQVLEFLISEADKIAGKPVDSLTREEKIEFVRYLDNKGAFLVTKSSDKVCEHLKISRFTLYNYLDLIRKENPKNGTEKQSEEA